MIRSPALVARQIRKTFHSPHEVRVLQGVDLELFPGQSIAIMGASGEGKSTLLHILGTLEQASSGELIIAGKSVARHPPSLLRNRHIGFVFQSCHLLDHYSAKSNVLMPALIGGREIGKGSAAYLRAEDLLNKVGLKGRADFSTSLLSGGEKQRVAIARALCNDPAILLADEPSGNLDHHTSETIHKLLMHCTKDLGKALIVVTHDKELAGLCDQVLTLRNGILA